MVLEPNTTICCLKTHKTVISQQLHYFNCLLKNTDIPALMPWGGHTSLGLFVLPVLSLDIFSSFGEYLFKFFKTNENALNQPYKGGCNGNRESMQKRLDLGCWKISLTPPQHASKKFPPPKKFVPFSPYWVSTPQ